VTTKEVPYQHIPTRKKDKETAADVFCLKLQFVTSLTQVHALSADLISLEYSENIRVNFFDTFLAYALNFLMIV
jgi:hypothetical protein